MMFWKVWSANCSCRMLYMELGSVLKTSGFHLGSPRVATVQCIKRRWSSGIHHMFPEIVLLISSGRLLQNSVTLARTASIAAELFFKILHTELTIAPALEKRCW